MTGDEERRQSVHVRQLCLDTADGDKRLSSPQTLTDDQQYSPTRKTACRCLAPLSYSLTVNRFPVDERLSHHEANLQQTNYFRPQLAVHRNKLDTVSTIFDSVQIT